MDNNESKIEVEEYILSGENKPRKKPGNIQNGWLVILMPLILVVVAILFYNIGANKFRSEETIAREKKLSRLHELIQVISNNYVDSVDVDDLYLSSINGMLEKLDPHSSFIPKEDVEVSNEQLQGHFGGVGIRFLILRDTLMVTDVVDGGPSFFAGLQSGDRIIMVDDEEMTGKGIKIKDVHDKLKGPFGSPVKLSVYRKNIDEILEFPINRGAIPLPSIDASYHLGNGVGVIKIGNFSGKTAEEFDNALVKLKGQGVNKLILDLRSNGGGYLHTAVGVVDQFLSEGKLIVYTKGNHVEKEEIRASSFGRAEAMKTAVIINSGSASASEIVSGALQDNDRAVIIGRRSFGKGLVQRPMKLSDSSELRLTVSRYYTPTGRSIQKPYGNGIDYDKDLYERYENGELQEVDSSIFENAEKFITPGGKTVYGGGGIMPDIFVPIDTTGSSTYFTSLTYSTAFRDFCFDYLDKNKDEFTFPDEMDFHENFEVSDELLMEFVNYAQVHQEIQVNTWGLNHSKRRIKNYLKGELASYLFDFGARYLTGTPLDKEIQVAIEELTK